MNLTFDLRWSIANGDEPVPLDPIVFALLRGVREGGHLNYAAKQAGVSYRHAWGLLRDWETRFGAPLLLSSRGRGAELTDFAELLLKVAGDVDATLAPALDQAALAASAELSEEITAKPPLVTMHSSHNERANAFAQALRSKYNVAFNVAGSEHALGRYRRGESDIAGFHLPLGDLGRTVAAQLIAKLDPVDDRIWLLEARTLGLFSRTTQPVRRIDELAAGQIRFVNRQSGSGTRLIFDGLLGNAQIPPGSISGYADEEYTHKAVAALVASGGADAGFGSATAAREFGLHFEALVDERFYLVISARAEPGLRRAVAEFCAAQTFSGGRSMRDDEFNPSVAVLKRIHRAGFWKTAPGASRQA